MNGLLEVVGDLEAVVDHQEVSDAELDLLSVLVPVENHPSLADLVAQRLPLGFHMHDYLVSEHRRLHYSPPNRLEENFIAVLV